MRVRVITLSAFALLLLCGAAWLRSYLPEYCTVRLHRGAVHVIFYDQQRAYVIDPANHPSQDEGLVSRWGTDQILFWARRLTKDPELTARRSAGLGFELVSVRSGSYWQYLILAAPFWALCVPPGVVGIWGATAWRRQRGRARAGQCVNCGYDLRESSGVCPECGTRTASGTRTR